MKSLKILLISLLTLSYATLFGLDNPIVLEIAKATTLLKSKVKIKSIHVFVQNVEPSTLADELRDHIIISLRKGLETESIFPFSHMTNSKIVLKPSDTPSVHPYDEFPTLSEGSYLLVELKNNAIFWQLIDGKTFEHQFSYLTSNLVTENALNRQYEKLQAIYARKMNNESLTFTSYTLTLINTYSLSASFNEQWGTENQYISGIGFNIFRESEPVSYLIDKPFTELFREHRYWGIGLFFTLGGLLPFNPDFTASMSGGLQLFNDPKHPSVGNGITDVIKLHAQASLSYQIRNRLGLYINVIYPTFLGVGLSWM